jgi:hypothetical protein
MRRVCREVCQTVAQGTGIHLYTINHILKEMIDRSRELNLRVGMPVREAKQMLTVVLTMQTMQVMQKGYHRIPL